MLSHYLEISIKNIDDLIELTDKDILDIKDAKHNDIFKRTKIKNDLIVSFENKKSMLDNELIKLVKQNKNSSLEEVLNDSDQKMLEKMKDRLFVLKHRNKEYARFVVTVSEFYNTLLDSIFPRDLDGYQKINHKPASFLKIRA